MRAFALLALACALVGGCKRSQRTERSDELLRQQREERAGLHRDAETFTGAVDDDGVPVCRQGALCAEQWFGLYRDAMCTCTDRVCAEEIHAAFLETAAGLGSLDDMTDEVEDRIAQTVLAFTRCNLEAGLAAIPDVAGVPRPSAMQNVRRMAPGSPPGPKPTCTTPHDQSACMQQWAHYYRSAMCACPDRTCGEPVYDEMKDWLAARSTPDYQMVLQLDGLSACMADVLATDPNAPPPEPGAPPTCTEGVECFVEWQAHWKTRVCECASQRSIECAKREMEGFGTWMKGAPTSIARGGTPSRLLMQEMANTTSQIGQCAFEAAWLGGIDARRTKRGPPTQKVRRTPVGPRPSAKPTCTTPSDMGACWHAWLSYFRDEMCACADRSCGDGVEETFGQFFVHMRRTQQAAPDLADEARTTKLQDAYQACLDDAAMTDPNAAP